MAGQDLWERYNKTRDPADRDKLIIKHLGLVKYLAGRLIMAAPPFMTQEDLEGYGVIGLLDAIDKFDQKLGTAFKNYAYTRIRGAILDEIRKQNWVPRSKWQKFSKLNQAREKLQQNGTNNDEGDLARVMGMEHADIRKLAAEYYSAFPVSLDDPAGKENESVLADTISDPNSPDPLAVITERNEQETLVEAIKQLPERDRLVLALYYQEEMTLKEIGCVLDVTESRVCQLHAKALQKLRDTLLKINGDAINKKGVRV
ncbi:sigma-70 family RNA polymerase sigma factor [Desulfotruncus alcoholivorax]|uniref:sigma-70 family RNA polymerase sigma factor n=1 Tax=Desulfotruncus alcoholivorax TaxID=265477 RepID=UPI0004205732|nr:FliA/WhiG family RNA polymerase sigma factor [Desulfotruncus alcoholivorax]